MAPVKKNIYSLPVVEKLMSSSNRRYLEFISEIDDPTVGFSNLENISKRIYVNTSSFRGFNLFEENDLNLFEAIVRGQFFITGFRNSNLRQFLKNKSSSQISRILKRLHTHKLIKKIGKTYKYYLTELGRKVIITSLKLRNLFVLPQLTH